MKFDVVIPRVLCFDSVYIWVREISFKSFPKKTNVQAMKKEVYTSSQTLQYANAQLIAVIVATVRIQIPSHYWEQTGKHVYLALKTQVSDYFQSKRCYSYHFKGHQISCSRPTTHVRPMYVTYSWSRTQWHSL